MAALTTAIKPQGPVERTPAAVYGKGHVLFRIGNGGAGATGLVEALAVDYLSTLTEQQSIAWVCNHSLNTQVALHENHIDLALTYERGREELSVSEGWSKSAGCAFHDHFCLAGPGNDPANVRSAASVADALGRIARHGATFHSRVDGSATMEKERQLWSSCGLEPWTDTSARWYQTSVETPAGALRAADQAGAYLLTDRSTLLHQTGLQTISNTVVFLEPTSPDHVLMNSCHVLYSPLASKEVQKAVGNFIDYLLSARGQAVISSYGVEKAGLPFFAPVVDGFASTGLARGRPVEGTWTFRARL